MNTQNSKFSRRSTALFWLGLVAVLIGALIYFGLIQVLYILATFALVGLLLIVAFADLENVGADGSGGFSRDAS